ncbi:MAG: response regulator transcription factor [Zoogloeaceae bacterium]|jgi:DNA-binding NarL/FixJ family response regulator|nr:response regulator transcription factor [Zoogloeaceae bacterium]
MKILIVEDHALMRDALMRVLGAQDGRVIREANGVGQALNILTQEHDFDLVLLDLALPGMDGFSGLKLLSERYPKMPVVILSAFDDKPTIRRALSHGAAGFIPKSYSAGALLDALSQALAGQVFYPPEAMTAEMNPNMPLLSDANKNLSPSEFGLTERQGEVLVMMLKGCSNREIANQLKLSEGTVKIHVAAIFKSLGVTSRAQAIVVANRYGITA